MRSSSVLVLLFVGSLAACAASDSAKNASSPAREAPGGAYAAAPAPPALEAKPSDATGKKKDDESTWKRSQIVPNATRLMVGEREELPLKTMQAKVTIDGFRARVVLDYVYANDRDRQLEGS